MNSCGRHDSVIVAAGPVIPPMPSQPQNPSDPIPLALMNSISPCRFAAAVSSSAPARPAPIAYRTLRGPDPAIE